MLINSNKIDKTSSGIILFSKNSENKSKGINDHKTYNKESIKQIDPLSNNK